MHILEQKIRAARQENREALIPFVTAGFPTPNRFWNIIEELDANGADLIEIGVPFSDPVADGPVVEAASVRALAQGITLDRILQNLIDRAAAGKTMRAGLVLMGYLNPFLQYGLERFAERAAAGGVQGCIVPDLPLEESGPLRQALDRHGIALIPLVASNTPPERMREYAPGAQGYVYVVSVLGVTGERKTLPPEATDTLRLAKQIFDVPTALGFGLCNPDQLADVPADAKPDAVIFGSALIRHLDEGGSAAAFLHAWKKEASN